uniref:Uncharacterized protein n=1 Tax=Tetranychus urticae TaxID=32264 RepID=T1K972_TETUR
MNMFLHEIDNQLISGVSRGQDISGTSKLTCVCFAQRLRTVNQLQSITVRIEEYIRLTNFVGHYQESNCLAYNC